MSNGKEQAPKDVDINSALWKRHRFGRWNLRKPSISLANGVIRDAAETNKILISI